jgi:hypothetical protein
MKKFILFKIAHHYPNGGMDDLQGFYETFDEAVAAGRLIADKRSDVHVYDLDQPDKIYEIDARETGEWVDLPPQTYDTGTISPPTRKWVGTTTINEYWRDRYGV